MSETKTSFRRGDLVIDERDRVGRVMFDAVEEELVIVAFWHDEPKFLTPGEYTDPLKLARWNGLRDGVHGGASE